MSISGCLRGFIQLRWGRMACRGVSVVAVAVAVVLGWMEVEVVVAGWRTVTGSRMTEGLAWERVRVGVLAVREGLGEGRAGVPNEERALLRRWVSGGTAAGVLMSVSVSVG